MSIFVGAFEINDTFHRIVTVIACTSIVITAVYILRIVGRILYGEPENDEHKKLSDATWDEKFTVICLVICVAALGIAPLWISNLVSDSASNILANIIH